ncbi:hypothetical protein VNO77_18143 [Canavalia gladiata]|uniref:Uncharacterized protein n=1 Tax=Canavalia gladiata TaxID=3824 RepID=A0AAN9QJD0_CANGL
MPYKLACFICFALCCQKIVTVWLYKICKTAQTGAFPQTPKPNRRRRESRSHLHFAHTTCSLSQISKTS